MATVMEFRSPADEFPLGTVFENLPDVTVELERLIPQASMIIPYFWVHGAEASDIESSFDSHAGFVNVELIDNVEAEYLMRAEWDGGYFGILNALAESDVVLLTGVGTEDGWNFEVRGETRESISEFSATCQTHDIPIEITAVHALNPVQDDTYELTDPQREALVLAFEYGYFDSPREASLTDIAAELGITQQSLSSRLRRGHRRLIGGSIINA